jgi:DMSO/TMAO reductase YedYZ molybdopterin-dependent catalytic subunit
VAGEITSRLQPITASDETRREFLRRSIGAAIAAVVPGSGAAQAADPFAGGVLLGTVALFGRGAAVHPLGRLFGRGLDARLLTDLSTLTPETLITSNERFYIRTSYPDLLEPSRPWRLTLGGLVRQRRTLSLDELRRDEQATGTHLLECAGNNNPNHFGLMSAAEWTGVPLAEVLDRVQPIRRSVRVLISGFDKHSRPSRTSTPGASWIFSPDGLERSGAFLATGMNGTVLPRDHGFPVRLVVPRWYGCACIKWVDALEYVPDDASATSQMQEFAGRTFQSGRPERARDYMPAVMDHAAMPVRIEKWVVDGRVVYRVVGILWGGERPTNALSIRFKSGEPYVRVDSCPLPRSTTTWTLWWHAWRPPSRGRYDIVLKIDDPSIRTQRLDVYFYVRSVDIDEV